jgi:hypothetical protein
MNTFTSKAFTTILVSFLSFVLHICVRISSGTETAYPSNGWLKTRDGWHRFRENSFVSIIKLFWQRRVWRYQSGKSESVNRRGTDNTLSLSFVRSFYRRKAWQQCRYKLRCLLYLCFDYFGSDALTFNNNFRSHVMVHIFNRSLCDKSTF